jgi:hypothetical protein
LVVVVGRTVVVVGSTVVVVAGSDVEVEVVDVDDVVVVGSTARALGRSALPRKLGASGNDPVSIPCTAASMKRLNNSAGNEPPFTRRPRTFSIFLALPSG